MTRHKVRRQSSSRGEWFLLSMIHVQTS
jgi:hypothetical protein